MPAKNLTITNEPLLKSVQPLNSINYIDLKTSNFSPLYRNIAGSWSEEQISPSEHSKQQRELNTNRSRPTSQSFIRNSSLRKSSVSYKRRNSETINKYGKLRASSINKTTKFSYPIEDLDLKEVFYNAQTKSSAEQQRCQSTTQVEAFPVPDTQSNQSTSSNKNHLIK